MTQNRSPMTAVDRAWLGMETPCNAMMVGAVLIFESPMALPSLKQILRDRLLRFRRFRQVVEQKGDRAWWVDDPYFDLDNHIHVTALPAPAGKRELQSLAADLTSTPLDPRKPLWQMHYVSDYEGGCSLIVRVHHCIADGISLVRVLLTLTDDQARPPVSMLERRKRREPETTLGQLSQTARKVRQRYDNFQNQANALVTNFREDPLYPLQLVRTAGRVGYECAKLGLAPADPETVFRGPLKGRKSVAWAEPLDLAEVKHTAKALKGTVNDVLMSVASGAIHDSLCHDDRQPPACGIRVAVPFNLRPLDEPIDRLGNRFGLVMVPLPVDVTCPHMRFKQVQEQMKRIKRSWQAQVTYSLLDLFGHGPALLERRALDILSRKASAVLTNVPGPREPVYLAGSKLKQPLFWVPQSGGIGVGMSIFSYAGKVQFGLIVDTNLGLDAEELVKNFRRHFDDLKAFSGPTATYPEVERRRAG